MDCVKIEESQKLQPELTVLISLPVISNIANFEP